MASLDRNELDRWITGNWGEDSVSNEKILVYIREKTDNPSEAPWYIYNAETDDYLFNCWTRIGAVDYCSDQGWDVRDGPVEREEEEDDEVPDANELWYDEQDEGKPGTGGFYA